MPQAGSRRAIPIPGKPAIRASGRRGRGFTLIELLVVLVILAVVAGAVMLRVDVGGERGLQREAERLAALLALGCERAERVGRDLGLVVQPDGYRFVWLLPQGPVAMDADGGEALRARRPDGGLSLRIEREGRWQAPATDGDLPQLGCSARGELTPFRLRLQAGEDGVRWQVQGGPGQAPRASRVAG